MSACGILSNIFLYIVSYNVIFLLYSAYVVNYALQIYFPHFLVSWDSNYTSIKLFFILSTALDALVWTFSTFPLFIFQVWAIYIDLSSSILIPNLWGLQVCNKPVTGIQHLLLCFSFLRFPLDSNSVHLYWKSFSIHTCCPSIPL